jgi:hypothetical protein
MSGDSAASSFAPFRVTFILQAEAFRGRDLGNRGRKTMIFPASDRLKGIVKSALDDRPAVLSVEGVIKASGFGPLSERGAEGAFTTLKDIVEVDLESRRRGVGTVLEVETPLVRSPNIHNVFLRMMERVDTDLADAVADTVVVGSAADTISDARIRVPREPDTQRLGG